MWTNEGDGEPARAPRSPPGRTPSEEPSRADPLGVAPESQAGRPHVKWPTRDGMWQVETTTMSFSQDDVIDAICDGNEAKLREMLAADAPTVLAARDEVCVWPEGAS